MSTDLKQIFLYRTNILEILYLLHGMKKVVRMTFHDSEIPAVKDFCEANSLNIAISDFKVRPVGFNEHGYTNKSELVTDDGPGTYFVYISRDDSSALAKKFERNLDHWNLGKILGYPECCINHFMENIDKCSDLDLYNFTVSDTAGTYHFIYNLKERDRDYVVLSHFPCSLECENSRMIGEERMAFIEKNYPKTAEILRRNLIRDYGRISFVE